MLKDRAVLGKSGHPSLKGNTNCETTKEKAKGLYTKFYLFEAHMGIGALTVEELISSMEVERESNV